MTRRRGHVRPRGPDRWEIIATANRRRVSRTVHGTRADAERRLLTLLLEVDETPATRATPPSVPNRDIKPPSAETVAQLIDAAYEDDPALGAFLWLATITGARRGELCGLRWSAVDLDDGSLLIERAIVHGP